MDITGLLDKISFDLLSVAHCRLGKEWNYRDVISSYSRLYLITEGEAFVYMGKRQIRLRKGYMYLIPSYLNCSYNCPDYMEQFYASFTIQLPNNLSIYQLFNFRVEAKAEACHFDFFGKLNDVNPSMELPAGDPKVYQRKPHCGVERKQRDGKRTLVSSGLLSLFVSEFIGETRFDLETDTHCKISESLKYLHIHLGDDHLLDRLAELSCMSKDHYTRKFRELTDQTPLDYINRHRVEKAQLLLNTTSLSCNEIADQCGFRSNAYFSRVFRKYVEQSPTEFRNLST